MKQKLLYNPTLGSVLMVEKIAKKYSSECGKYQLWKKLPKKMMYQTYLTILNYLLESNKIAIDPHNQTVLWIWDPEGIEKMKKEGLIIK